MDKRLLQRCALRDVHSTNYERGAKYLGASSSAGADAQRSHGEDPDVFFVTIRGGVISEIRVPTSIRWGRRQATAKKTEVFDHADMSWTPDRIPLQTRLDNHMAQQAMRENQVMQGAKR